MLTIYIDNQAYQVAKGQNLLQACLGLKLDLPYFCWHPAMGSVGACRQCAMTQYRDEEDQHGRIIVACMTQVTEGLRVSMQGQAETAFRDQVISALMTHHPHDCPVCAEGGECHLQDMTVMSGHHSRGYQGTKTTFVNQDLGPLIKHEMNRCITCYRCVRFYQDYAGGTDLAAQASKNHVYFGRQCDGTLSSPFAGNLVEVCPTGVFTDKPFGDHYSRKWDLQSAPSVCQHCAIGCNISLSERYGSVRRVTNRLNDHLNGYFLCDRGRFGFGFVNNAERCCEIRLNGSQVDWDNADLQKKLTHPGKWLGIGSSQASLEDNFALQQLVGAENFCATLNPIEERLITLHRQVLEHWAMPSLAEMEQADAILILGEDICNSAPRAALAIRQALSNKARLQAQKLGIADWQDAALRQLLPHHPVPFAVLASGQNDLLDLASLRRVCNAKQAADYGFALAAHISASSAATLNDSLQTVAELLQQAKRPLIVTGWAAAEPDLLLAAANLRQALDNPKAMLAVFASEANSLGLGVLMQQGHLPAQQLPARLDEQQCNLLVLDHAGADFKQRLSQLHPKVANLVRLSQLGQQKDDEINLPIASFSEASGTLVNYQGVAQPYQAVTKTSGQCLPAWQWLVHLAKLHQHSLGQISDLGQLREQITAQHPALHNLWQQGQGKTAMQPPRYSGRTAMLANQTVHEPKPFSEPDNPYKHSMEGLPSGYQANKPMPYSWSPGWNSNQSNHKFKDEYRSNNIQTQSGARLIPPTNQAGEFEHAHADAQIEQKSWTIQRQLAVFGSDSLSLFALPIATLSQQPQLWINRDAAQKQGLGDGQFVNCDQDEILFRLCVSDQVPAQTLLAFVPADRHFPLKFCEQLSVANQAQIQAHQQQQSSRQAQLVQHSVAQQQRLLTQDEHIPIRFIEGIV